ncbi:unnamed protein product [Discula destructiva]
MQAIYLLPLVLSAVQATNLLLPLYVYPSWLGYWDYIYDTIAQNPDLEFDIIINPSNGPGGSSGPGYNSDYVSGVAHLNTYPNVHLFGYVHTSYGGRSRDEVNQDTAYWADWSTYTAADISVAGIFFDEVPNDRDAGLQDVAYMADITDYAYSLFDKLTPEMETIYNVGQECRHPEYFDNDMADYVIVFENYASEFSSAVLRDNVPVGAERKSSILIHDFINTTHSIPDSMVTQWLQEFSDAGIGSGHILNYSYAEADSKDSPADLGSVARALA